MSVPSMRAVRVQRFGGPEVLQVFDFFFFQYHMCLMFVMIVCYFFRWISMCLCQRWGRSRWWWGWWWLASTLWKLTSERVGWFFRSNQPFIFLQVNTAGCQSCLTHLAQMLLALSIRLGGECPTSRWGNWAKCRWNWLENNASFIFAGWRPSICVWQQQLQQQLWLLCPVCCHRLHLCLSPSSKAHICPGINLSTKTVPFY